MMSKRRTCLVGFALASLTTSAFANDDVPPVSDAPAGEYAAMRGVQGPAGMFSARLLVDINLSDGKVGKPISIAPDLYYSVTDKLQLGLTHTGPMGWQARPGVGLCVTGTDNGCANVYDNLGADVMYGVLFGEAYLSLHGSLFFNSFDRSSTSVALGVTGRAHFGDKVALLFDPKIAIEVDDRDVSDDVVYVPLELAFQVAPKTQIKLLAGILGGITHFSDTYEVPVGIGIVQNLTKHFDLGARFSFDNLLGNQPANVGAADTRSVAVLLNIRS